MASTDSDRQSRSALVFGARNLGRAVVELLLASGWSVAAVARSAETLQAITDAGALALSADVTEQASVCDAVAQAADAHGGIDLIVNAASAYGGPRTGPFGGGPLATADADAFDSWAAAPARSAFAFLSGAAGYLVQQERPATLIQVTGGSSRRAMPGRGLWAAGAFGVCAITQAAALELRPQGIHVALLIVDAGIEPFSAAERSRAQQSAAERSRAQQSAAERSRAQQSAAERSEGANDSMADPPSLAEAVLFLAEQGPRAATHELQVTPLAETWAP